MKRLTQLMAVGTVITVLSFGQTQGQETDEVLDTPIVASRGAAQEAQVEATVHDLIVMPMKEPMPALRYSFWTSLTQRQKGNAVPYIYRALMLQPHGDDLEDFHEEFDNWFGPAPGSDDFPEQSIQEFLSAAEASLSSMRIAATRDHVNWDWSLDSLRGTDTVAFLLPELQEARQLARVLTLKARLEIHQRDFKAAIDTLRDCYLLAHAVGQERTLVNSLVGTAIANMASDQVMTLISTPGSPNVYWALAQLPRPLINYRGAYDYERAISVLTFPFLKDVETATRTQEQWRRLLVAACADLRFVGCALPEAPSDEATLDLLIEQGYPKAKKALQSAGYSTVQIDAMSKEQALAVGEGVMLRRATDDTFKWAYLPLPEAALFCQQQMESLEATLRAEEPMPIAQTLLPALSAARNAEMREDSIRTALMMVEAIRMHAAHHGSLPNKLDDITVVPVLTNPATGQSYPFRLRSSNGSTSAEIRVTNVLANDASETLYRVQLR